MTIPPPQKRNKKAPADCSVSQEGRPGLTPREAEILTYLNEQGLTVAQVAARRGWSKRYVRQVRQRLQKKGVFRANVPPPLKNKGDPGTSGTLRLHAQKFTIELIQPASSRYFERHQGRVFFLDGNNVQCFSKVVCIQANKEFQGKDEDEALARSMEYWARFFARLENDLGTPLMKDRKQNITMTYAEWATENSELARECEKRDRRLRIYAADGKLRFTTDWSKTHEHEAHHHKTGRDDSVQGNRFVNDVLDHPEAPTFTELVKVTLLIAQHQKEAAAGMQAIINLLKPREPELDLPKGRPDYFG